MGHVTQSPIAGDVNDSANGGRSGLVMLSCFIEYNSQSVRLFFTALIGTRERTAWSASSC